MDWLELLLDYIRVLIWPLVVLAVVFVFRGKLRDLIEEITEVAGGPFTAKFEKRAKQLTRVEHDLEVDSTKHKHTSTSPKLEPGKPVETVTINFTDDLDGLAEAVYALQNGKAVHVSIEQIQNEDGVIVIAYLSGFALGSGAKMTINADGSPRDWKTFKLDPAS